MARDLPLGSPGTAGYVVDGTFSISQTLRK